MLIFFFLLLVLPTAPTDYTGVTQPLMFDSGVGRVCFDVPTTGDSISEDTETFRVSIISVTDSLVSVVTPDSAVVRIIEEDGEQEMSVSMPVSYRLKTKCFFYYFMSIG